MHRPTRLTHLSVRCACAFLLVFAVGFSSGPPAHAAKRARLSRDLAEALQAGTTTDVIVHGDGPTVDRLAARYGGRVTKRIRGGAVLRVTAGQLDALSQDED